MDPPKQKKRIAIIGAGWSGLIAIKSLKEENEYFEPVCFEATKHYGGTWRYHEEDIDGLASVMATTVINHSKEMGALSDYPPPKDYPNYMPHYLLFNYWSTFAEKNDCFRHIRYNHDVVKVEKARDYEDTGRWVVVVKNKETGEVCSDTYDGVCVCVGHSTYPKIPQLKGMENFKGKVIHTHSLKRVDEYKNKKVAVIGIGCSGLDAAVETSNVAKQVYLSTRRGAWILPRLGPYGLPFDYALLRRWVFLFFKIFPVNYLSLYLEKQLLGAKFSHGLYGLKPKHHVLGQDPAVSDMLPYKLLTGAVVMKGNISTFTEDGIIFDGEDTVTELDSVIMATGYHWKFPFLNDDVITVTGNRINLYKCIFPPQLKHPTLAVIGFIQPLGGGFPLGEIQCRWVTQLMRGNIKFPSQEAMFADLEYQHGLNAKRYPPSDRLTIHVDYIPYLDDISAQFGAKPNLLKMAFTDPKLFWLLFYGPSLPYQYRLQGPHKWSGAREAIMTSRDRVKAALLKGKITKFCDSKNANMKYFFGIFIMCWIAIFMSF